MLLNPQNFHKNSMAYLGFDVALKIKNVMTRTVILYHSSHVTLSLCDFEILEFFSWKLVSGRYVKKISVLLNSHKVTKNVFYATFKVDLLAN